MKNTDLLQQCLWFLRLGKDHLAQNRAQIKALLGQGCQDACFLIGPDKSNLKNLKNVPQMTHKAATTTIKQTKKESNQKQ